MLRGVLVHFPFVRRSLCGGCCQLGNSFVDHLPAWAFANFAESSGGGANRQVLVLSADDALTIIGSVLTTAVDTSYVDMSADGV